jgi:hypothetical protein
MLNCRHCGLTNRPYAVACDHCLQPLQDEAAADVKQREFDALPAKLREEQELHYDRLKEHHGEHRNWLQRNRIAQGVCGALILDLSMNVTTFFAAPWCVPIDLVLGATAALLLNRLRGGAYIGLGLFLAACVVSWVFRMMLMRANAEIPGLLPALGVTMAGGGGYFMGRMLEMTHVERGVIG